MAVFSISQKINGYYHQIPRHLMESACRSGFLAAEKLLAREGIALKIVAPDLPRRGLARLLMGDG